MMNYLVQDLPGQSCFLYTDLANRTKIGMVETVLEHFKTTLDGQLTLCTGTEAIASDWKA